jgi:hypothetical protein
MEKPTLMPLADDNVLVFSLVRLDVHARMVDS